MAFKDDSNIGAFLDIIIALGFVFLLLIILT